MKVYRMEVLVYDFDDYGSAECKDLIENAKMHNASVAVKKVETYDIGEWEDNNPLNKPMSYEDYRVYLDSCVKVD